MALRTIRSIGVKGKTVLVRVDFNVPLRDGKVASDKRIRAAIPTIRKLIEKGAKQLILVSHLGRPKGKRDESYSLAPVAKKLQSLLKEKVFFVPDCMEVIIPDPSDFKIVLLENLRFYPEEKDDDAAFAKQLASYADVYVNDAFGTSHRKHASVHAVTRYLPSAAGLLLESELKNLDLSKTKRPLVVIMGGAKVSDKIGVIKNVVKKADTVLIGGAMMFTFYRAMGYETGKSLVEEDKLDLAKKLLSGSKKKIMLPVDMVAASSTNATARMKTLPVDKHPKNMMGLDIGPETVEIYTSVLKQAKTIIWNGPMGLFEQKPFDKGTNAIAKMLAASPAKTIVGGGDSVAAVEKLKLSKKMDHISTGGGASLELLEGKTLPAVKALLR
ncbi:MAG: phosphoglycerate kinase [Nanoarchaeota archaeon]